MRSLVTTSHIKTSGEEIVFLGEWCKKYNQKDSWIDKKHTTIPYHWEDRKKFNVDHDYLSKFYEELLTKLCVKLNEIHDVEYTKIYWRIVIGPWLLVYVPVLFDRWENINGACAFKENLLTAIPDKKVVRSIACDYNNSLELMGYNDDWNYLLYCNILLFKKNHNIKFFKESFNPSARANNKTGWLSIKNLIVLFAHAGDAFLNKIWFKRSYKYVLYKSFMPLKFMIKIALRQFQLPRIFGEFDVAVDYSAEVWSSVRQCDWPNSDNDFENFAYQQVLQDIPKAYIENYLAIKKMLKLGNFPVNPEIIMTASAHYYNEIFKIWAAEMVKNGSKLILCAHGGAMRAKREVFLHEEKICDHKVTWCMPYHDKHIQLSPTKVVKKNNYPGKGNNITLIGCEFPRYNYRIQSAPMSSLILEDFNQKVKFIKLLNAFKLPKFSFKIRPYPDRGWSLKDRYIDNFGTKTISTHKTLQDDFLDAKVIICTYPETTFFESMQSGIPTVLLYVAKYWELDESFAPLARRLVKAKIAHTNSESAAMHIKNIYTDPQKWWNNDETKEARLMFDQVCGVPSEDVSIDKEFHGFLMNISNKK
ncbi:MAG: hypothetical protein CMA31_03480 [Euryarchaeota archaeon]|nr:hypothetical protein [Euryarchaeota archaeon]